MSLVYIKDNMIHYHNPPQAVELCTDSSTITNLVGSDKVYSMLGVDKSNTFAFITSNDMELVDATIISNMNGIILSNDDLSGGSENHHLVATSVDYLVAIQQFGSRPFEITLAGDEESDKHSLHSSSGSCQTQFEFDVGSRNYAVYFLEVVGPEIESILFFKTLDNLN